MKNHIDRRNFLCIAFAIGTSLYIAACTTKKEAGNLGFHDCDDYSMLSETDIAQRKGLGYVDNSPLVEANCRNCKLWISPKEGFTCGGCTLFRGPVQDNGYCTYWATTEN